MKTIEDKELLFEEKLVGLLKELDLLPEGFRHRVRFHGKARDKRKTAVFENNWSPNTDSIRICFEPVQKSSAPPKLTSELSAVTPETSKTLSNAPVADPLSDLIRTLETAESHPGHHFVSIKWFRDTALPLTGFPWTRSEDTRRNLLRIAVDKRLILTNTVPNPKSPQFPVTAIRLNRLMPEVQKILGNKDEVDRAFHPVEIRGEDLSAIILRERR